MILKFPTLDVLSVCLGSQLFPAAVAAQRAIVTEQADGAVWLQFDNPLSQAELKPLRQFGMSTARNLPDADVKTRTISHCWEAIPVLKLPNIEITERTPVIFDISDSAQLTGLVNEILRQGNDRQAVRFLSGENSRTLLKVLGPPYFTLLKALPENQDHSYIKAFIESPSRVWTELGHQHPLADKLIPATGQHIFIHADSTWEYLSEEPFQDLYALLECQLPHGLLAATEVEIATRFSVPLKLIRGSSTDEVPELWVLNQDGMSTLDSFVNNASDNLLQQLSFAVGEFDSEFYVLVRVRPSRLSPPILPFDGLGLPYRSILKINNLFAPMGRKLHPPLRRDVIRNQLANDETAFVWLQPIGTGEFQARSISERSFQPLSDWVDYVLDQHQEQLSAWAKSTQFEFEPYVCADDLPEKPKPDKRSEPTQPTPTRIQQQQVIQQEAEFVSQAAVEKLKAGKKPIKKTKNVADKIDADRQQLEADLKATELAFIKNTEPLDSPSRQELWDKLATLNESLKRYSEAAICLTHRIWEETTFQASDLRSWLQIRIRVAGKQYAITNAEHKITDKEIAAILKKPAPLPVEVAQLAAYIAWQGATDQPSEYLQKHLGEIQSYIEKNELSLSIRSAWISWLALSKLAGGDILFLARSRDRILERLYHHGLPAELELPAFLRAGGTPSLKRYHVVKDRFLAMRDTLQAWSKANLGLSSTTTYAYIDLIYAYGLAKLGEKTAALALLDSASQQLSNRHNEDVHYWLRLAYKHRIREALDGKPNTGSLPDDLTEYLESMGKLDRYKVDRLRQHSSIIEPHEKMDPYHSWKRSNDGSLQDNLANLFDVTDRNKLLNQINVLFKQSTSDVEQAQILTTALELSPRLGEKQATAWLLLVDASIQKTKDPVLHATLLERAMMIAAHYGQTTEATRLFQRLRTIVTSQKKVDIRTLSAIESMLSLSFRVLRRLGMRDELAQLLDDLSNLVHAISRTHKNDPECLKLMLQLAGGWFYFGDDRGWDDINYVRDLLFSDVIAKDGQIGTKIQTDLAIAYIAAVGQAPLEESISRIEDLLENLTGIHDSNSVNSHYSLKQIDIVETLVLTMINEDFSLDKSTLRWLDEEEFLIRQRIHQDLQAAIEGE